MLTITEQILFTIKSSNQRLIYVNTLVRKPTEQKKTLYKKHKSPPKFFIYNITIKHANKIK